MAGCESILYSFSVLPEKIDCGFEVLGLKTMNARMLNVPKRTWSKTLISDKGDLQKM